MDAVSRPGVVIDTGTSLMGWGILEDLSMCSFEAKPSSVETHVMQESGEQIPPEGGTKGQRNEFGKHDHEPSKYIKRWTGIKSKTGASYSCDIVCKRFSGPEVFFNPEIYSSNFGISLPAVIDKCIQLAPIDTRRLLYKAFHTKAEYEEFGASICKTNPVLKGMY